MCVCRLLRGVCSLCLSTPSRGVTGLESEDYRFPEIWTRARKESLKARNFRRNCFVSSSFQDFKSLLPTTPSEMIQECLVMSVRLLKLLSKGLCGIHRSGHHILIPYGFDHFAFPGDSGQWEGSPLKLCGERFFLPLAG